MEDFKKILQIYESGRRYMRAEGNFRQWINGYPSKELLADDIQKNHLYVMEQNHAIYAVFAFIIGIDSTYLKIDNGSWKREVPYGTIHRISSNGSQKGILRECIEYCKQYKIDLRIDTHADNRTMQHAILKNGFEHCGTIYVEDRSPREAYQYVNPFCTAAK